MHIKKFKVFRTVPLKFSISFFKIKYSRSFRDIRKNIFKNDHFESLDFLKNLYNISSRDQKYFSEFSDFINICESCKFDSRLLAENWDDKRYDYLIKFFVQTFGYFNKVFQIKSSSLPQYDKLSVLFHYPTRCGALSKNYLIFDTSRKFGFARSIFGSWFVYTGLNSSISSLLNKRIIWTFQTQFNYSDVYVFDSISQAFRYVQIIHPILPDMYDLPLLINELRPYFDNPPVIHVLNNIKKLQHACTYYMRTEMFNRILFDRYLYTHAKYILDLPYTTLQIFESKYTVNFDLLYHSRYFLHYFECLSDNWFYRSKWITEGFEAQLISLSFTSSSSVAEFYKRINFNRLVKSILSVSWLGFSRLQAYFEGTITPFISTVSNNTDKEITRFYSYRPGNQFIGLLRGAMFNRITSRIIYEFSKFLYSSTPIELIFITEFVDESFLRVNQLINGWSTDFVWYSNTLLEHISSYKDSEINRNFGIADFENLFTDLINHFFDYELYLFVFFGTLSNMLDNPDVYSEDL